MWICGYEVWREILGSPCAEFGWLQAFVARRRRLRELPQVCSSREVQPLREPAPCEEMSPFKISHPNPNHHPHSIARRTEPVPGKRPNQRARQLAASESRSKNPSLLRVRSCSQTHSSSTSPTPNHRPTTPNTQLQPIFLGTRAPTRSPSLRALCPNRPSLPSTRAHPALLTTTAVSANGLPDIRRSPSGPLSGRLTNADAHLRARGRPSVARGASARRTLPCGALRPRRHVHPPAFERRDRALSRRESNMTSAIPRVPGSLISRTLARCRP
ncbi:hypothetical protein C2E23DRAFT_244000 [Lenzites betulinus]|nr:hypothetical protein C2E23DRAFT_244000 [Lenzites betulinus]